VKQEESDLYGLPLDEFVPKRTELEKRLRNEGDRERAAAVKKLPKPSVAAWAVNQASRCRPEERRALLAASEELREVQERLIAGDASAVELEKAATKQREAIDGLVEAAEGLLTSEGKSMGDATLARVRETLAAVATDPDLAKVVEAGTLDRERQAAGLGFGGLTATPSPRARREAKPKKKDEKAAREAKERAKAAKQQEREAKRQLDAAEREARKAVEQLEKRERQLEEARAAAEPAQAALEAARSAHEQAAQARDEAEEAAAG
jgi:hypothetical protein